MEADLSEVEVFADQLQARGDPRGELLSLELAAERAPSSAEARRFNREAQRIRDAHPSLVWPRELAESRVRMRAGFVVGGGHDELFAPGIPIELALSVRHLNVGLRRLEDCLGGLVHARERGLRLDSLTHRAVFGPPTNLAGLRSLAAVKGTGPVLDNLELPDALLEVDAISSLTGLRSLRFNGSPSQGELCSLAPLQLERLRLRGAVDPVLVPLFGNSLTELELRDATGSLAPLAGLPWLRSLWLFGYGASPVAVSELASLYRLEVLILPELHELEQLTSLCALPLQVLVIGSLASRLAGELWRLRGLESLSIDTVRGGSLDLGCLAELPKLRSLSLPADFSGGCVLPPGCEELEIQHARQRLAIAGNVVELHADECDPRCVPPPMLANLRQLTLTWAEGSHDDFLAELPRACPKLERLSIRVPDEWRWDDAPAILGALPQLRSFELRPATNAEIAEIARAFPELCPLHTSLWPRSAGEAPRVSASVSRKPSEPLSIEDQAFARLRGWARELRASKNLRGELLELELAAELADDPLEARALNREAAHLRNVEQRLSWPPPLRQDRVLLRGGMPVFSTGGWLDSIAARLELTPTLRGVSLDHPQRLDACISNLARGRAHGLRLEQLELASLHVYDCPPSTFAQLREFAELDTLTLAAELDPEQRRLVPDLRLRTLSLGRGNVDRALIARFAPTLTSLELGASGRHSGQPASLDGLVLPRLERLVLGEDREPGRELGWDLSWGPGWDLGWALRQESLRALALSTLDERQLELLAGMSRLESLRVPMSLADLRELLPRLATLRHLSLRSLSIPSALGWQCQPQVTLDLEDSALESLVLDWEHQQDLTLELRLPPRLRSLDLRRTCAVTLRGSISELACTAEQLGNQPRLCEGVRRLRIHGVSFLRSEVLEYASMLEHLELEGYRAGFADMHMINLEYLPRLRTVVLRGAALGTIAELSTRIPEIQLHGVDPGFCDPARWPRGDLEL